LQLMHHIERKRMGVFFHVSSHFNNARVAYLSVLISDCRN
jgi:hypothetical protein